MMFVVRSTGARPEAAGLEVKLTRKTPPQVPDAGGKTDFFCVGDADVVGALRGAGWDLVDLHDGYYHDDAGGGVAIWGQGRYWEIRDTHLSVKEAVGPGATPGQPAEGEQVEVRRAIFGA